MLLRLSTKYHFKPFNLSTAANHVGKPLLLEEFGVDGLGELTR